MRVLRMNSLAKRLWIGATVFVAALAIAYWRFASSPDGTASSATLEARATVQGTDATADRDGPPSDRSSVGSARALDPNRGGIAVLVHDVRGNPIEGAGVFYADDARIEALARTDPAGGCTLDDTPRASGELVVSHPDYQVARRDWPRGDEHELLLILKRGSAIEGRVFEADGITPAAGVDVMALVQSNGHARIRWQDVSRCQRSDPRACTAKSDANGNFRIDRLHADWTYKVVAAGYGRVALAPVEGVAPGGPPISLTLVEVYAAWLQLTDADSGVVLRGGSLRALQDADCEILDDDAVRLPLELGRWAGLPDECPAEFDPVSPVLVFRSTQAKPRIGPIQYFVDVPGYPAAWIKDLWATPIREKQVADRRVVTRDGSGGTGTLRIRLENWSARRTFPPDASIGRLVLHAERRDERSRDYAVDIAASSSGTIELVAVPCATYRAVFRARYGFHTQPSNDGEMIVEVCGARGEVHLDVGALGCATIELARAPDVAPCSQFSAELFREEADGTLRAAKSSIDAHDSDDLARVSLCGLPAGTYRICPRGNFLGIDPPELELGGERYVRFVVERGGDTHLLMQLLP